jgi:predicted nucleic acid-binding protein
MNGYLIDTNILSELRKPRHKASEKVLKWWESVRGEPLFLSVMVLGEVRRGIDMLRGRDAPTAEVLERWLAETRDAFSGRILSVGIEEALCWGRLSAIRALPQVDGLLAATALEHDLTLVSRNAKDFSRLGLRVINPFTEESS